MLNNLNKIIKDGYDDTAAQFQDRCVLKALEVFWKK